MPRLRAAQERSERRRRRGSDALSGLKLAVNEAELDRERFEYRFVNDKPGRIAQLTKNDDYDFVTDPDKEAKPDSTNEGTGVSVYVGGGENGQPMRGYLLRKPKKFYHEDQAEKQALIDEQLKAIKRGAPQVRGEDARQLDQVSYVPEGGISINDRRS